jgi:hypothetical protein
LLGDGYDDRASSDDPGSPMRYHYVVSPEDSTVTTFGQKAIAIATVAGMTLVLLAISVALASLLLLLVAIGFAFLGAVFVHRLLRL